MNITIGTKIKELRKARRITQEQLADSLNISFQAISKWENGIALPDITLVPKIAGYFGVSIDEMFDFSLDEMNREIEQICSESCKYRETDMEKGRDIINKALEKYPGNDVLLANLLYVLNYRENPDEVISTASRLIDLTDSSELRYDALRFMAYAYQVKGDDKSAAAAIEKLPEIYFTKLTEMAYILKGKEKYAAAEKQKWVSFENLIQMMYKIAECYESEGNTVSAVKEIERALALISDMEGEEKIAAFANYTEFFSKEVERLKN